MHEPGDPQQDSDEIRLDEADLRSHLAPLAWLGSCPELRDRNRSRVFAALGDKASVGTRPPAGIFWWRREIRVPLPAAAAVVLWLTVSTLLPWFRSDEPSLQPGEPRSMVRTEPSEETEDHYQVLVSLEGNASFVLDGGA